MKQTISSGLLYFCLEERLHLHPLPSETKEASAGPIVPSTQLYIALATMYCQADSSKYTQGDLSGWRVSGSVGRHRLRSAVENSKSLLAMYDSNNFIRSFPDVLVMSNDKMPGKLQIYYEILR